MHHIVTFLTGSVMAQADSSGHLTAGARVSVQVSPRGICGEQSGTETDFPRVLRFFLYHYNVALHTYTTSGK
jgi:hypothetical protein